MHLACLSCLSLHCLFALLSEHLKYTVQACPTTCCVDLLPGLSALLYIVKYRFCSSLFLVLRKLPFLNVWDGTPFQGLVPRQQIDAADESGCLDGAIFALDSVSPSLVGISFPTSNIRHLFISRSVVFFDGRLSLLFSLGSRGGGGLLVKLVANLFVSPYVRAMPPDFLIFYMSSQFWTSFVKCRNQKKTSFKEFHVVGRGRLMI